MSTLPPQPAHLRGAVDLSSLVRRRDAPPPPPPGETPPAEGLVVEATDQNFGSFLELSRTVPVIVDLWADWCEPCKLLSPVLEKVVAEYGGRLVLATIDVDANPQLSQAFQAQSIPTVAALIAGQPVQLFSGAIPEAQVRQVFEQVLQIAEANGVTGSVPAGEATEGPSEPEEPPLPPLHQEAYDAIARGDLDAAIAAYTTAVAQDPRDAAAVAGLAQTRLLQRLSGAEAADIRSRAASDPADVDAQLAVADLDVSGGHLDDGFGRLLDLMTGADAGTKDRLRVRLLDLFEVAGADDPRVASARRRLTMLLY